jgi:hypothetical protein
MFIGLGYRMAVDSEQARAEAPSPVAGRAAAASPPAGGGGVAFAEDGPSDGGVDASAPPDDAGRIDPLLTCADPPQCTGPNGTGIYAGEGGFAGITAWVTVMAPNGLPSRAQRAIMITHFIDNGSGPSDANAMVTFAYGYFDPFSRQWTQLSNAGGQIESADYQQQTNLKVNWVRETDTAPIWTLRNPATKAITTVTDTQLLGLALHISFAVPGTGTPIKVTLDFNAAYAPAPVPHFKNVVRLYNMQWRYSSAAPNAPAQQYCHGPYKQPDTAVFQQGIDVDPMTGTVNRQKTANLVMLSCSLGAPAIVYAWGYPYHGSPNDTFYFDAGIHMKRASYCGDANYYTVTPTPIQIKDDKSIQNETPDFLEARWDRDGATCVNLKYLRHPELGFNGKCGSQTKPDCQPPQQPEPQPSLIEGPRYPPSP